MVCVGGVEACLESSVLCGWGGGMDGILTGLCGCVGGVESCMES